MINQYLLGHKAEVTDGEKIWYIAELSGFLMEVNILSKELKAIWKIPCAATECSYRLLFYYDHKIYIFPYYQKTIYIYDLHTMDYEQIEIKKNPELMGCIKRDKFLYVFGSKPEILKFNMENHTVMYIDMRSKICNWKEIFSDWFWTNAFTLNEFICIPVANTNIIILIDQNDNISSLCLGKKQEKWILVNIQADSERYHAIYCRGEKDNVRTYIAEFDLKGKLIWENSIEEKYSYKIYPFLKAVWVREKWICLPFGRAEVVIRDKEHEEILYKAKNGIDFLSDVMQGLFFCSVQVNSNMICGIDQSNGSLLSIALDEWKVDYSELKQEERLWELLEKSYQDAVSSKTVINEMKSFYDLKSYINFVCNIEDN